MTDRTHQNRSIRYSSNGGSIADDPAEIEQDIDRTRHDMDDTLDELATRLQPRHLLNDFLDYIQSSGGMSRAEHVARDAGRSGRRLMEHIRQNPIPALLCATGLTWLFLEHSDEQPDDELRDRPEYGPAGRVSAGDWDDEWDEEPWPRDWSQEAVAWSDDYDWSTAEEDEQSWNEKAERSLAELRESFSDTSRPAHEQLRAASTHVVGLSGRTREDIHARWANLREHSGSFVDARTGEPYDDNYGREWQALEASDYIASEEMSEEDQEGWSDKMQEAVSEIRSILDNAQHTTKQKLQAIAHQIGGLVGSTRDFSSDYSRRARGKLSRGAREARDRIARGASGAREQLSRGASSAREWGRDIRGRSREAGRRMSEQGRRMKHQLSDTYAHGRERWNETLEDHPLALAAGALATGLLSGLLLPRTRREDEMMGATSDELMNRAKQEVRETGEDMMERGRHVVRATTEAVREDAEREGLTPASVAESARHVAKTAAETARSETDAQLQEMKE